LDLLAVEGLLAMEPLLEQRLHRGGGQVAAPDEPLVSLKDAGDVKRRCCWSSLLRGLG
jgi:hypothetical protein